MSLPLVAIVGRPNVGKSSLLNCMVGRRISIVDPMPGVTRDRVSAICALPVLSETEGQVEGPEKTEERGTKGEERNSEEQTEERGAKSERRNNEENGEELDQGNLQSAICNLQSSPP